LSDLFPLALDLRSFKHLSLRLGLPIERLQFFADNKSKNVRQIVLTQVRNGRSKERTVHNPSDEYKDLLRRIHRQFLRQANLPEGVLGGVVGKCVTELVAQHCHQEAVFSIDLKNFFPSIKSGRVFNLFLKMGCLHEVAGLLTDLVTLDGSVPQGFPTSPMLANLAAFGLDCQQLQICRSQSIRRTRWIDDIVFSGRTEAITNSIVSLVGAVAPHGFRLNNRKTEFTPRCCGPNVLGLDLGSGTPRVPRQVVDKVADILEECRLNGPRAVQENYECNVFGKRKDLKASLDGRIRHVERHNPEDGARLRHLFDSVQWSLSVPKSPPLSA
jgi:hypothetical protein